LSSCVPAIAARLVRAAALLSLTLAAWFVAAATPGQAHKLAYDEAELDIGADALATDTPLGIASLSEAQVPALDTGMTNVTRGPRRGWRFTPTPMKFKARLKVTLPYSKALIPAGLTEQDVRTFWFDTQAGRWRPLERVALDTQKQVVTSYTEHFTDMINATVTVPDHPQAASLQPTSIKDIRAADPGAQVVLIDPPRPNARGEARLGYPIELPPGRQGLQPEVALHYNSAGGNGWLGVGWDLPMQAISIDTRWGVPRYDDANETETYMLSGQQLTPRAHRGALRPRTPEKVFHTRVEGGFHRIVRHGTRPSDYWWEVTDKRGIRYFYGATPELPSPQADATLADDGGHVFLWALREVRDPHGNTVRYRYARVSDPGVAGGTLPGANLYLQRIAYTGSAAGDGAYAVTFTRDRELGEPLREDKGIDARGGFKRVTADRLRRIDVSFQGALVRRYELQYTTGAFGKTLLQALVQRTPDGAEFNRHSLAYHDDIRDVGGRYRGFEPVADWTLPGDGVGKRLLGVQVNGSALGGTVTTSLGAHLYVGVGAAGDSSSKVGTGGFKVGGSRAETDTLLALADIDGDGLPDKVFRSGDGFAYRRNLSGPRGTPAFGVLVPLPSLPALGHETVSSFTFGGELYLGPPLMADKQWANTRTDTYLSDVNGDGLADLVSGGRVLFGFINTQGVPSFSADSALSPVPVGLGQVDSTGLLEDPAALEAELAARFPLVDMVRRWVAPYDGVVRVEAPVRLLPPPAGAADAARADGVSVAIQLEGNELWRERLQAADSAAYTPTGVDAVPVRKGDRLYFRLQSVNHGAFDRVDWRPLVSYTNLPAQLDVNGLPENRFDAGADFVLAGRRGSVTVPLQGSVRLATRWEKQPTSDDVTLLVTRNGSEELMRRRFAAADSAVLDLVQDLAVQPNDVLAWRVLVDSPVDATRIVLHPSLHYTALANGAPVQDEQGQPLVRRTAPFDIDTYSANTLSAPQGRWVATADGMVTVQPSLAFSAVNAPARVVFTVKKPGALLAKTEALVAPPAVPVGPPVLPSFAPLQVQVRAGDELTFDFSTLDTTLLAALSSQAVTVDGQPAPSALHAAVEEGAFPRPYRGWAAVGFKANPPRDGQPLDAAALEFAPGFDPQTSLVMPLVPEVAQQQWRALGAEAWVAAGGAQSSRLGATDITQPRSQDFAGAAAPSRLSRSTNLSVSVGLAGASQGDSDSRVDFLDLNGDAFPDVLSEGGVQFTRMTGGLEDRQRSGPGRARHNHNESFNLSLDGAGNLAAAIANGRGMVAPDGGRAAPSGQQATDMPSLSLGGSRGTSDTTHDLIDINGDGLPDKVHDDGQVELNLGYRFGPKEPWGGGIVNHGEAIDGSLGLGLAYNRDFYSWGGGAGLSGGEHRSNEVLVDLNHDGLPDKLIAGQPQRVRFNTGNGFGPEVPWPGGHERAALDKHISLNGGAYFTIGFNVWFVRVVFNPGVNASTGIGRPEYAYRDVDGDGYADHLRTEQDGELKVARNPIGRTLLLKRVERPLGGRIDIDYQRDGNTYDLPQSRWVMSRVSVFDGVPGDGVDTTLSTYRYEGGRHDRLEREFYGYARVVEEQRDAANGEALYRSVTQVFRNDTWYTHGLLAEQSLADAAGRRFTETLHTYLLRDVDTQAEPVDGRSTTATVFPQPVASERRFHEGGAVAQKRTVTRQRFDALGNVVAFSDSGDTPADDDVEATLGYSAADAACAARYIVGVPTRILVHGNGSLMRRREASVDCPSGDETQVRQFLADGSAAVTDLTYFPDGNLQSVTGPANKNGQRYRLAYTYDPVVATHVAEVTDSFGYRSRSEHDLRFGRPTTSVDLNGQRTTWAYDSAGRADSVVGPYEQGSGQATLRFEYHPEAAVPYAVTRHVDKDAAGALRDPIETLLFIDGLKRVLQTKKDATVAGVPGSAPSDAMTVSGRVLFDHAGRTVQQFYPVVEAKGTNTTFNTGFDSIAPTRTRFDVLDRPLHVDLPDGTATQMAYSFGADRAGVMQFRTTVTDANGRQKHTYRDVRTLITTVQEFNQGSTVWTSYAYDPLRQIVQVVDDKGNVTRAAYDHFGRRTVIDSPDSGRTETVYDLASNPVARITATLRAQGRQITLDHDHTRLVAVNYPNHPANNLRYEYGPSGAPNGRAGRIAKVSSQMGSEERDYGPLGEVVKEVKTITTFTTPNAPETYTTLYRYDTWNRLLGLTYPDGEALTYAYDSGGLLKAIQGVKKGTSYAYLDRLEYDKFEQRAFMQQGNGVRTQYSYDPQSRRLANLQSGKGAAGGGSGIALQNLQYGYDPVGNIVSLANAIAVPPPNQMGGPTEQRFGYDDLYRLTSAQGSYRSSPDKLRSYQLQLGYDSIHNIVRKTQGDTLSQPSAQGVVQQKTSYDFAYAYAPSGAASVRPHAPVHIGERSYAYDANGNQLGWTHDGNGTRRTMVWDDDNRLQSVFDDGQETAFKYDDEGERVIKRGPLGETVYVNQHFTIREGEIGTKHVWAGSTRLVSKLVKQDRPGSNPLGDTPLEKDLYFFHPDHLGSSHAITDAQGQLYEHLEYFPFGEAWVQEASNTQQTPYQFTGKELDEETGLHYFGARYYDARTSVWQSADPALEHYLDDDAPAMGVRVPQNLALYSYSWNNPLVHRDPDGRLVNLITGAIGAGIGAVVGPVAYAGVSLYRGEAITGRGLLGAAAGGAVTGGLAGLTGGGSLLVQATAVGGASVAGGVVNRGIVSGSVAQAVDPKAMAIDGAIGVATFGVAKAAGAGINAVRGSVATKVLTSADFPAIARHISQKQLRHIAERPELAARGGGSFLNSMSDAQAVLDAYHAGTAKILGKSSQGFPVVRVEGVTGTNVNVGAGFPSQPTNVFIIKGTASPSVVPTNPNWTQ
jgi:RHS repeat-associated protein